VVDYTTELYMAWLLLVEVLPLPTFTEPERPYDLNRREANPAAVASRHWYKTASNISETATANEPIGVRSLPGHFATRGDWFLAVAEGSRSGVLADRALDLLSSPRANFVRLQMGLGLPTRRISSTAKQRAMRTALATFDEFGHRKGVTYEEIRRLGCEDRDNAWWLWRSSLKGYDRQARLWEKSVTRVLAIWNDVRRTELTRWVDCFLIYDSLAYVRAGNELPEWAVKLEDIRRFASRTQFERLMDFLYEQLAIAGELDGRKDARKKWAESLF
jgi:hypothetical protein